MERGVFINYRGVDSHSYGALLYTELARRFGAEHVFLDAESIPAGADFVEELLGHVRSARVLLAVIGPSWLTAADTAGRRRIDDPEDWIRRELVEAFAAEVRVIPILTEQTAIPAEAALPPDIAALSRCQARHLRYREPTTDLDRIVDDLISLVPVLAEAARARVDAPHRRPPEDAVAAKADDLADEVEKALRHEVEQQRLQDQEPLPLRWRPWCGAAHPAAHPAAHGDAVADAVRTHPSDPVRQLDHLVAAYERSASGWLVVLGRAGAGKTVLVMRFALARLRRRGRYQPVPVIFSLGSWNPGVTTLPGWLIGQLERDHPFLAGPSPTGGTWARRLVGAGLVLPILDGFDEIAVGQRAAALTALNAGTLPRLVTSRRAELDEVGQDSKVVPFATGVELTDLTLDDSIDYLLRASNTILSEDDPGSATPTGWPYVLGELRDHPEQPASARLSRVLTTPLMVTLARFVYELDGDPAELLNSRTLTTGHALEEHLLDCFVRTAYARFRDDGPVAEDHRRRDLDRARRWFGYLAVHLGELRTQDIEWWRIGTLLTPRSVMLVVGATVGLVSGLLAGLAYGTEAVLAGGFAVGLRTAVLVGPLNGLGVGLTFGIMHGFATKLAVGGPTFEPSLMHIQFRRGTRRTLRASFLPRVRGGLFGGVLFGVLWCLATAVLSADQGFAPSVIVLGSVIDLVLGIGLGAGVGITVALGAGFEAVIEKDDRDRVVHPSGLLRTNRTTVLTQVLLVGLVVGSGYGIFWGFGAGPVHGLVVGLVTGLMVGFGVGTMTAWGRWVILARVWLPLTRRLPRDLNAFLDDAYDRHVLRRVGAVYQFRHERLRDRLDAVHRNRHDPS